MNRAYVLSALVCVVAFTCLVSRATSEDEPPSQEEMMKRFREAAKTGPQHEALKYYLGDWTVKADRMGAPGTGHATFSWVLEGRWMGQRLTTTFGGHTTQGFGLHGYDRYSKSYVTTFVSDMDTSMNVSRGPRVDREGKVQTEYGSLREYMTGELDKPYKVVRRHIDDDHFVVEIWDLGIGEAGRAVLTYKYARKK